MDTQSAGTLQSPSTYSESSKTGSSKSGDSTKKDSEDLTKDNAASPVDLECHIQAERITKILDEAVYKTKLALCLPYLVQEFQTLNSILTSSHMDDLIFIFEQYDTPLFSTSLLNMAAVEDVKAGDLTLKNRLNPELGHLMYIMNSYPALRPKVEEMVVKSAGTLQSPSTYSESSKTGSSKSGDSTKKDSEDLTKDNAASPVDLECHIQAERITKILDEAVYKTKLALCLPYLVQEFQTLNSILTSSHMDDLIFIFEQYDTPLFSTSLLNMAAVEDVKAGDLTLKNRLNPELGHLMYIMNSYPALRPKVEEMVVKMMTQYTESDEDPHLPPGLEYLKLLEHFRSLMIRQMETTAAEELSAKINTRKLEASNEKLLATIQEYTDLLRNENEEFEETMRMKTEMIAKLEKELAMLKFEADSKLKKKILDSDRQMVLQTRAHMVKNEMLKEEEVEAREVYESVLKSHLIDEKNQRARRFKVETQLLSWLQKYDVEMSDKQVELDEFTEKYEDELRKCDELEIKLAEQDKEYIPLMAEREEEYHQEMTEKMNKFQLEHAARVIQSAWRDVLANRAEKKKLKKLIKKMNEAAAKKQPPAGGKK